MAIKNTEGGFRSRKLLFALFAILLVFLGCLLAAQNEKIGVNYATMVSGIEVITGLYLTGNVASKWTASKGKKLKKAVQPKEEVNI
jgi:hypothetical protein